MVLAGSCLHLVVLYAWAFPRGRAGESLQLQTFINPFNQYLARVTRVQGTVLDTEDKPVNECMKIPTLTQLAFYSSRVIDKITKIRREITNETN